MLNWLYKILEKRYTVERCRTCEVLERQLELERYEKRQLLERIINPTVPTVIEKEPARVTIPTGNMPWKTRQRLLEQEDRERARLMAQAARDNAVDIKDLEKEMGIVEAERENAG